MTQQIVELLDQVKKDRFYGKVALEFKSGHLILIRKEETIQPRNEGTTHDHRNVAGSR
jgi:hypothetical protein